MTNMTQKRTISAPAPVISSSGPRWSTTAGLVMVASVSAFVLGARWPKDEQPIIASTQAASASVTDDTAPSVSAPAPEGDVASSSASRVVAASPARAAESVSSQSNQPTQEWQALRSGSEDERADALINAVDQGADIPGQVLEGVMDSDSSDRVRLLAFNTYLDSVSSDTEAINAVLEHALANSSGAVQEEARRRMNDFQELLAAQASTPLQGQR